jgi:hypothetical protein
VQGQRLRVTVQHDLGKHAVVIGRLTAVSDSGLQLVDDRKTDLLEHCVSWGEIVKAKIEVEF